MLYNAGDSVLHEPICYMIPRSIDGRAAWELEEKEILYDIETESYRV